MKKLFLLLCVHFFFVCAAAEANVIKFPYMLNASSEMIEDGESREFTFIDMPLAASTGLLPLSVKDHYTDEQSEALLTFDLSPRRKRLYNNLWHGAYEQEDEMVTTWTITEETMREMTKERHIEPLFYTNHDSIWTWVKTNFTVQYLWSPTIPPTDPVPFTGAVWLFAPGLVGLATLGKRKP